MSVEDFYKPVRSVPVEGSSWEAVDGVLLPTIGIPFKEGHLESLCRFVVRSRGSNETSPQLVQVSPSEGRTFEVRFGQTSKVLFEDEYGNLFGCIDLKGNKSTIIRAKKMVHAPSGFSFWGMQESDSIARAARSSAYLRSKRIDTEILLKVMSPSQILYQEGIYTQEDFKTKLLIDTARRVGSKHKKKDRLKPEDIPALASALEGMNFVQTLRGKQVSERLFDLYKAPAEVVQKMIQNAFWFYNYQGARKATTEDPFKPLDPKSSTDVIRYFGYILPAIIGSNYGQLHQAGVVHVHPHLQNISLKGGIYDTDSIKGAPLGLGDEEITDEDVIREMQRLLYGYWNEREGQGLIPFFKALVDEKQIPSDKEIFFSSLVESNLLRSYIYARGWDSDLLAHISKINRILNHPQRAYFSFAPSHVLTLLSKFGQWKYEFELENVEDVAEEMFKMKLDLWSELVTSGSEESAFIQNIFDECSTTAPAIIRRRVYTACPEAFDSVEKSHGPESCQALLDLITLSKIVEYPLQLLEKMYGTDPLARSHNQAVQFVLSKIG